MSGDLDLETGDPNEEEPKGRGKSRGRPSTSSVSSELKKSIDEGLSELAEWLESRDSELAQKLRDGAPKMAEFLAYHAAKRAKVARVVKWFFAKGGPFAFLRSFGPTVRALGDRIGAWRDARVEAEWEEAAGADGSGDS